MNKLIVAFALFFFTFNNNIYSQSQLSFFGLGGINYIPMKKFSNFIDQFPNSNSDKISFSATVGFKYRLIDNHLIYLSAEYLNFNAYISDPSGPVKWFFQSIPVTFGYEYQFLNSANDFIPFIGIGVSYADFENEETISPDIGLGFSSYSDNSWGFEVKLGVLKKMVKSLSLSAEIKYRYLADFNLNSYNDFEEVNLSGIGLLLGIYIKLL